MRIIKIGTFNEQGSPIQWHLEPDSAEKTEYCLGIIKEKVCINGVEVVPWTEERNRCIARGRISEGGLK